jgi:hypothetical protein
MTEAQARAAGWTEDQIAQLTLSSGAHSSPEQGHCLLEVVSMFAGEDFGDSPRCVDYVLAAFGRAWNDGMRDDQEREQLKRYIVMLPGTAQGEALSQRRGWMAADWLIRTNTPMWLDLSPKLAEHAAQLRALAPITDEQSLAAAMPALERAQAASAAARDAAWAAARDAAWAAAWAAAWDAAQKAEGREAQYQVAYDTVKAFLEPTTQRVQADAHELYLRMINARLDEAAQQDKAEASAD